MKKENIILMQNIGHSFKERQILNNLSFSVDVGDKLIFNAPSGFGKSTLFNIIMGYIQPDLGRVVVDGIEANEENVKQIRERIAFLPQNMALPNIPLKDFIRIVEKFNANEEKGLDLDALKRVFAELQLPEDVCDMDLGELSGGEKQRIMLAIVMALDKKILLLDEALAGIDFSRAEKVLLYLSEKKDLSIIFISHDVRHIGIGDFRELEVVNHGS